MCHAFNCKKGITYSQALRLNCVYSETNSFDKSCNDLEKFLSERGYSSTLVRKEILRARKIPRNKSPDKEKSQGNDSKLTFNVTYYAVFRHLKTQLKELHIILACDEDHKKVFSEVPWFQGQRKFKITFGFKSKHSNEVYQIKKALTVILKWWYI